MSKLYHGDKPIVRMYLGTQELFKEYDGSTLRWQKPAPQQVLDATIRSTSLAPQPNTTTTKSINKPAGTVAGDLMVFYASGDSGTAAAYTVPTGWTQLFKYTTTTPKYMAAYKFAGASEPASYTFGMTSDADGYAVIHTVMNVDTAKVPVVTFGTTASSKTAHTAPSVTPNAGRGLLISQASLLGGSGATWAWTPPANMTESADVHVNGWMSMTTAWQRWDSTAATGTRTFSVVTSTTTKAGYTSSLFIPSAV